MPKPFDFSGYSITPIKPYVDPASNPVMARFGVLKMLTDGIDDASKEEFARRVIGLNLADLGVRDGVNFNSLLLQEGGTQGTYSYVSNTLSVVNRYIQDPEFLGLLLNILGHETKHKHQHEINKTAKYFSPDFASRTVGFLKQIPTLIGEEENKRTLYLINNSEKEAFTYGNNFAEFLLTEALRSASKTGNIPNIDYLSTQLRKAVAIKNVELSDIRYREKDFIANHLPQFYKNCSTSFKGYLSLARTYNNRGSITYSQQQYLERIENSSIADGTDYQKTINAAASVLAYLPKREFVKDFIDFALSARDKNVATDAMHYLTQYAIPLTKTDVTRFFVCSDMYKGSSNHFALPSSSLSRIDEATLVQSLVVSQGFEVASKIIEKLKDEDTIYPINFGKVDSLLSTYADVPIFSYNGQDFAGCSQVLDFVMQKLVREGKVNDSSFYKVKGELSQNLANIVTHFENPILDNVAFNSALENFIADPYTQQFEEAEAIDETSKVLTPEVAEKSAEYCRTVKEQKTEEQPEETEYVPVNADGKDYLEELTASLNALAKSLKELAEVLSREEVQKALIKICQNNSNGEKVLDTDAVLKDKPQETEDDEAKASCERDLSEEALNADSDSKVETPVIDGGVEGLRPVKTGENVLSNGVVGGGENYVPPTPPAPIIPPPVA